MVDHAVNRYLSESLKIDGMRKLRDFIDSEVKSNIKTVPKPQSGGKNEVAFVKTSTKSSLQTGGNLYLYSTAWQSGADVFGAGTLSEQYQSGTSYHITTTVTSPSGRANTTGGDWNYAALSHNTGLSIGDDGGNFTVQANFEQAEGYYDEYGNFVGTGTTNVGTAFSSVLVRPQISISAVNPATHNFDRNSLVPQNFTANISLSADIGSLPQPIFITVEFNEQNNPGVAYTVRPNVGTNPTAGRLITISHNNPGGIVGATFRVEPALNENSGTVTNQFRISRVSRQLANGTFVELTPGQDFDYGTRIMNVAFTIPPPPQTAGGGSGGGPGCFPSTAGSDGGRYCPQGSLPTGINGECCQFYSSPLLLDIDGDGYEMTDYYHGVPFDVSGKGYATQTSWTAENSDDAWLVLDRNQNNRIDDGTEMFGDASEQPVTQITRNGFASLAIFDAPGRGGNADGKITRGDAVFRNLRLWRDRNHNGVSEPEELSRLPALDVVAVFLDYKESKRTDEYGNRFKFRAKVRDRNGTRVGRWAWDVFLVISPPPDGSLWHNASEK